MWRSVIIYNGERLNVRDNWLVVSMEDGKTKKIPLEDLYCLVIDNRELMISVPTLTELARFRVHVIFSNEKHLPSAQLYPMNTNYHSFRIFKKQMAMSQEFMDSVWQRIVYTKILNQAVCLGNQWVELDVIKRLNELAEEVVPGDKGNREAISAKLYFRNLFGYEFVRMTDNSINALLDYGYAIIRSGVAKSLVAHGFNCVMGVHHISETNDFNLADDFMEPLRPIVDDWVATNNDCYEEGLTKHVKGELVNLYNKEIIFDGKNTKVRYAIDSMVRSFVSAVETKNPDRLILPEMIIDHA